MEEDTEDAKLYHERQVKELCALHALNNLLQKKQAFTKKDLDNICNRLSPGTFINPHKSMLGLGNYDVNVLMAALQEKGFETIWFDKRKDVDTLATENIMGFILNIPTDYKLGFVKLPIHRKHWIAIRYLNGLFMNLDSKLDAPSAIGNTDSLLQYLRSELSDAEKELLLVVEPSVYESSSWRRESSSSCNLENSISPAHCDQNKQNNVEVKNGKQPLDKTESCANHDGFVNGKDWDNLKQVDSFGQTVHNADCVANIDNNVHQTQAKSDETIEAV